MAGSLLATVGWASIIHNKLMPLSVMGVFDSVFIAIVAIAVGVLFAWRSGQCETARASRHGDGLRSVGETSHRGTSSAKPRALPTIVLPECDLEGVLCNAGPD